MGIPRTIAAIVSEPRDLIHLSDYDRHLRRDKYDSHVATPQYNIMMIIITIIIL